MKPKNDLKTVGRIYKGTFQKQKSFGNVLGKPMDFRSHLVLSGLESIMLTSTEGTSWRQEESLRKLQQIRKFVDRNPNLWKGSL